MNKDLMKKKSIWIWAGVTLVFCGALGLAFVPSSLGWAGWTCFDSVNGVYEVASCRPSNGSGSQSASTPHTDTWVSGMTCNAQAECPSGGTISCSTMDDAKCVASYNPTLATIRCSSTSNSCN